AISAAVPTLDPLARRTAARARRVGVIVVPGDSCRLHVPPSSLHPSGDRRVSRRRLARPAARSSAWSARRPPRGWGYAAATALSYSLTTTHTRGSSRSTLSGSGNETVEPRNVGPVTSAIALPQLPHLA